MKRIFFVLALIAPNLALAHGDDFVMSDWIFYPLLALSLSFPLTFLYTGYLVFRVEKASRGRFVWLYVFALCLAVLAFVCLSDLLSSENKAWVENLFGILVLLLPVYTAYISYNIDKATQGKYTKLLLFYWTAVLVSMVLVGIPLLIG